jgi:hypothetical protein
MKKSLENKESFCNALNKGNHANSPLISKNQSEIEV